VLPSPIELMLPTALGDKPVPDHPRFSYEFKWDGYRALLRVAPDGTISLTSRNGNDFTAAYPELTGMLENAFGGQAAILDGEIVALDEHGRPDFTALANRRARTRPASFFAFDLLRLGDTLLLDQPYTQRRGLLEQLEPADPNRFAVPPRFAHADLSASGQTPRDLLDIAARSHLEGVVAKVADSVYRPGLRSPDWLKKPIFRTREVVLGGWRPGQASLSGSLGALLLGAHDPATGDLVYLGDVGTGFTDQARRELKATLIPMERPGPPFPDVPRERAKDAHWVEPRLVGEVMYRNLTPDGRLRHTSWRGLRPDRDVEEIEVPSPSA
jgi:bifunctional non-homologous end joining protein LigD